MFAVAHKYYYGQHSSYFSHYQGYLLLRFYLLPIASLMLL